MKVKLLRKAWTDRRIIEYGDLYAYQLYSSGWRNIYTGTLKQMLTKKHERILEYIKDHPEFIEHRVKVIC